MIDENKREWQTELPEETQDNVIPADLPAGGADGAGGADEPQEVVLRYTSESDAQEVVECYVHSSPLPARLTANEAPHLETSIWRQAAEREKKRRRRGAWIFVACMGLLIGVVIGSLLLNKGHDGGGNGDGGSVWLPGGEEGNASSIINITGDKQTTIPRCKGDPAVRLSIKSRRGEELSATDLYAKVNPAVVTVVADEGNGMGSVGTGVIMTSDGYVITNAHVISGGKECMIVLDTGMAYEAKLVGYDLEEDLAVLKAQDATDLPVAEFGNSDELMVGEKAYAIGNPLGVELRGTLTDGIISAVNRDVAVEDGKTMTMLQTTAALNNGNSGGPLINSSGQIVGINTLKMSNTGWEGEANVEGLGFAIPISSASFVINDLIAHGEFRGVPTIGITVITVQKEDGAGMQVEVYSVEENYGAQEAGVQVADVILAADGQTVYQTSDLLAVRRGHIIGDTIHLTLLRDGQIVEADVILYSSKER